MAREFTPNGLPAYTVRQERGQSGAMGWSVYTTEPRTFAFNPETGLHDLPEVRDWSLAWSHTAKGAVAAAHKHARWVASYDPHVNR